MYPKPAAAIRTKITLIAPIVAVPLLLLAEAAAARATVGAGVGAGGLI